MAENIDDQNVQQQQSDSSFYEADLPASEGSTETAVNDVPQQWALAPNAGRKRDDAALSGRYIRARETAKPENFDPKNRHFDHTFSAIIENEDNRFDTSYFMFPENWDADNRPLVISMRDKLGMKRCRDTRNDADQIRQLKQEAANAQKSYVRSLRRAKLFEQPRPPQRRMDTISVLHQAYTAQMLLACMEPLMKGLDADRVFESVGMTATLALVSKNFRAQFLDLKNQAQWDSGNYLRQRVENKRQKYAAKADKIKDAIDADKDKQLRHEAFLDKVAKDTTKLNLPKETISKMHEAKQTYLEHRFRRTAKKARGSREMFTYKSAALTQIGLLENAYSMCHKALKSDPENYQQIQKTVMEDYNATMESLMDRFKYDGLDPKKVDNITRRLMSDMVRQDRKYAIMYNETAYGDFDPVPDRVEGDFMTKDGRRMVGGCLSPRPIMNMDEHEARITNAIVSDIESCLPTDKEASRLDMKDLSALHVAVAGYSMGWNTCSADFEDFIKDNDNPMFKRYLEVVKNMNLAMASDGLSERERNMVYSSALSRAMDEVAAKHPDIASRWSQIYNDEWLTSLRDASKNPHEYFDLSDKEKDAKFGLLQRSLAHTTTYQNQSVKFLQSLFRQQPHLDPQDHGVFILPRRDLSYVFEKMDEYTHNQKGDTSVSFEDVTKDKDNIKNNSKSVDNNHPSQGRSL